jgi:hypothetical protein
MTAASAPVTGRPRAAAGGPGRAAARLLGLELRHSPMPWLLPVAAVLFWLLAYRKAMAEPPLWNLRAAALQSGALVAFVCPVTGAAAWAASRDGRRRTAGLVAISARPRWARLLTAWAATAGWAVAGYLACAAVLYGVTARQAHWGGPLWWPAVVAGVSLPAFAALGFAAGTAWPGRLAAPLAAIAAFFVLVLSTELIVGSQSYWQVSPIVAGGWDIGAAGTGSFYPYLPDLSIAQVMFLAGLTVAVLAALGLPAESGGRRLRQAAAVAAAAGLLAAGTGVALAGTGRLDAHGMIAIPALHDAASDRPLHYTPACRGGRVPVCLNPAYAYYLPAVSAALGPVLTEVAGLPGAPVRVSQAPESYRQGPRNQVLIGLAGPQVSGRPPVWHLIIPDQLTGPPVTISQLAAGVAASAGPGILASVIGPGRTPAQRAVLAVLSRAARLPAGELPGRIPARCRARGSVCHENGAVIGPLPDQARGTPALTPGTPAYAAARRFAALPAAARHAWLAGHLSALRAGRIALRELP